MNKDFEKNAEKVRARAQETLDQLSKGEKTLNQIRQEFDLGPINDAGADKKFITKE